MLAGTIQRVQIGAGVLAVVWFWVAVAPGHANPLREQGQLLPPLIWVNEPERSELPLLMPLASSTSASLVAQRPIIEGEPRFSPMGDRILTFSTAENRTSVYDANGQKLFDVPGVYPSFNANSDRILTFSASVNRSYVYDAHGQKLFDMPGIYANMNATGDRFVTFVRDRSYVYDAHGQKLIELQGSYPSFNTAGDRILTDSDAYSISGGRSYIYDGNGQKLFELPGATPRFNRPVGK